MSAHLRASEAKWKSPLIYWSAAIVVGLACFFFVPDDSLQLAGASVACLAATILLYLWSKNNCPNSTSIPAIIISTGVQFGTLAVLGLFRGSTMVEHNAFEVSLAQYPAEAVFPLFIPCFAAALVSWFFRRSLPLRDKPFTAGSLLSSDEDLGTIVLGCGAGLVAAYYVGAYLEKSFIGYLLRVMSFGTTLFAFFAGRSVSRFPRIALVWIAMLVINFVLANAIGGRLLAFMPAVLFALGAGSMLRRRARLYLILSAVIVAFPSLSFLGALGAVRGERGRDIEELLSYAEFEGRFRAALEVMLSDDPQVRSEVLHDGIGRLLAWPNSVVCILSPNIIPYRGLDTLRRDIIGSLRLFAFAGDTRGEYEKWGGGSLAAQEYGFLVNEYTSVEFGIVADGWSRGGPVVAFVFSVLFSLTVLLMERFALGARLLPPALKFVLMVVCGSVALQITVAPWIDITRQLILYFTFWLVLLTLFSPIVTRPPVTASPGLGPLRQ